MTTPSKIELTDLDKEVILCAAEGNLRVPQAADVLHYSITGMQYRFARIHKITGLDPHNFWDMCKLLQLCADELPPDKRALLGLGEGITNV